MHRNIDLLAWLVLNVVRHTTGILGMVMARAYRILIAEDELLLALFLGRLIGQWYPAATVRIVADGLAALRVYEEVGADLLIASHGMPLMDGPTFIRAVRTRQAMVPIVGISGDAGNEAESRRAGATAFLSSPFTIAALRQVLYKLLPS